MRKKQQHVRTFRGYAKSGFVSNYFTSQKNRKKAFKFANNPEMYLVCLALLFPIMQSEPFISLHQRKN